MKQPYGMAHRRRGFTLVEIVIAMGIVLIAGLGAVGSVIYTRQSMELEKQRLAALHFCRQALEQAESNNSWTTLALPLVPFNSPGLEIAATVSVSFFDIRSGATDAGTVDWENPLKSAPGDRPALCRVTVEWQPSGSWSRTQTVQMDTIVRAGCL